MKTKNRKLLLGLLAAGVGLYGWRYLHRSSALSYETVPVKRGDIRSTVNADGTCSALVTIQVGSQVSGTLKTLYADFNSRVYQGQLIAEIDPAPFQAKVDQAQAALDSAKAALEVARAMADAAEFDIRSARAQQAIEDAAVKAGLSVEQDAQTKFSHRQDLTSIVSPEDLETARTTYETAVADRRAAEAQRAAAEAVVRANQDQYQSAAAQVQGAMDQVHQAEAALAQTKLDLDHTRITSPIDGVVISRDMDAGQTVAASFQAPTLFEIAQDLTQMQVDVNIDESDVGKLKLDQTATFTVDALPGTTFQAVVRQIRKSPINILNVITYDVVMAVANPDLKLFPGMTASVHVLTGERRNVLKIPNSAFRYRPAGQQPPNVIYVLDGSHKAVARKVEAGISNGTYTEIAGGDVHEGDAVVVLER